MAIKANLTIDQGTTYSTSIVLTDTDGTAIDLTGYTIESQIRKTYTSSTYVAFTTSKDDASGTIFLSLSANQSSNLVAGRYVYDVEITSTTNVISRIVEGIITVTPQVTRS